MPTPLEAALEVAEMRFLALRDAHDALEVARARGAVTPGLEGAVADALRAARAALEAVDDERLERVDDRRAVATMRRVVGQVAAGAGGGIVATPVEPGECSDARAWDEAVEAGYDALTDRLVACYAAEQAAVRVGGATMTRLEVLARLSIEDDPAARRRLFLALEPVWRAVDGDGGTSSPYRRRLPESAARCASGRSPIAANAVALGIDPATIEPSLVAVLEAWRAGAGAGPETERRPIEPWDWWYEAGAADRVLSGSIPLERVAAVSETYHRSLGADPVGLRISYDTVARPGRPPIPVAYTTFGRRSTIEPWVFATYTGGGLGELTEYVHETGHAIHIAAIRSRPAFADWPDSDAFTEALAELTALDTAEPAWQERWLGRSVPEGPSLRGRYADVVLDVAWALLEIRLHADPDRAPNEVWTGITGRYLGIAPHPELSWWAMRGQLVQEPGYMANYAIGAMLAADMRAAIRAARGDWTSGDPGWYVWVAERLYRFGLERPSGEVLASVLGRPPSADALLAAIGRVG